jgi:predicted secreted Zn-dependent protease
MFAILVVLEREVLPLSTPRLRYEAEKAACIVAVAGNTLYSAACIALMAILARLAANAIVRDEYTYYAFSAAAGEGTTAAVAGLAG